MFWKFYALGRWLLTGFIALTFGYAGWMLISTPYEPVTVEPWTASSIPGSGYESGYEHVDTDLHRYVDAVNAISAVIDENVTIINIQSAKKQSYKTEYNIGNACGTMSVAIERWLPDGCEPPGEWRAFDAKWSEAMAHFHKGADLLGVSDPDGYDEFDEAYALVEEAYAVAPEGAL